jgi:hypothetical protein
LIKNLLSHNNFAGFVDIKNAVNNQKYYSNIIRTYNDLQKDIFNKENNSIFKLVSNICYVFLDKKEQINSSKEFNKNNFYFYYYGYLVNHNNFFSGSINNDLSNLEGEFAGLLFNKINNNLQILTDRFASRPLFYSINKNILYFSNNPYILARWINNLNYDVLGVFQLLKFGHTIGDITTYSGVKRLNPGSLISIVDGKVEFKNYWNFKYNNTTYQKKNLVDDIFDSFVKGNEERLAISNDSVKKVATLSGGLDSRFIAYINKKNNLDFLTISLPEHQADEETEVAKEIASVLKLKHSITALKQNEIKNNLYLYLLMVFNGFQSPSHSVIGNLPIYLHNEGSDQIVIGGWPGDVLIGSYVPLNYFYLSRNFNKYFSNFIEHRRGIPDLVIESLFQKKTGVELSRISRKIFLQSINNSKSFTLAQSVSIWAMKYRQPTFSFSSPANSISNTLEVTPFLSYQYNDLLQNLSANDLYNKNLYKKIFQLKMKEMAKIKYSNTKKLIEKDYTYPIKFSSFLTQKYYYLYYKYLKKEKENKYFSENILKKNNILDSLNKTKLPFDFDNVVKLIEGYNKAKKVHPYDQHIYASLLTVALSTRS